MEPRDEDIDEFFGEARKSSQKQFYAVDSESEGSGLNQGDDSEGVGDDGIHPVPKDNPVLDLQLIMDKRR